MERDIFSGYLKEVSEVQTVTAYPRQQPPLTSSNTLAEQNSLRILEEISKKLDKLDCLPTQQQVITVPSYVPASSVPVGSGTELADISIENGLVVLPDNGVFQTNVYLKDGKVFALGKQSIAAKRVIDATGKYVLPGIIDPHVHLGLFAPLTKDLESETKSAILGGITTIGCYMGGQQSHFTSFPEIMEQIQKYSYTDVVPHFVISTEEQKTEIQDYMEHLGVTSFKVYMNGIPGMIPDVDDGFIWKVLGELKKGKKQGMLCAHAENRDLIREANKAVQTEQGETATIADWTNTHPDMAEEEAVIRLSYLAEKSGVDVYFVHMTSKVAMERLQKIKPHNPFVHVETTSPYLSLTRYSTKENTIKMEPPFREPEDVEALWQAVEQGLIDTIGTDNTTITKEEKQLAQGNMWKVIPGYPALETHLSVLLHEGVIKRGISIEKLITHMTKKPAELFGVYPQKGTLLPGSDGDVVIVDLQQSQEITAEKLHSRSDFSLYEGKRLQGVPVMTIQKGQIVAEKGIFVGAVPGGQCLQR